MIVTESSMSRSPFDRAELNRGDNFERSRVRPSAGADDPRRKFLRVEHHAAETGHGEQVAVPGGLSRVAGQHGVRTVIVDELFRGGEESHSITRSTCGSGGRPRPARRPSACCPPKAGATSPGWGASGRI